MSEEEIPPAVAMIRSRMNSELPPIAKLLGFELTHVDLDRARIELDAGPEHANPMGTLHGGVLCDIADAAMSMAFASGLTAKESFTTLEIKMNFLRPVWTAHLVAEGKMLKRGKTVGLMECRITDQEGELVAYATSTAMVIPAVPGQGWKRSRSESA